MSRWSMLLLLGVAIAPFACGDDGDGSPGGFGGDPGDFCEIAGDCNAGVCCTTDDCGFGMCSSFCDSDVDCPSYMGCRSDVCLVLCPTRDDRDCPAGFECDEHDGQYFCKGD